MLIHLTTGEQKARFRTIDRRLNAGVITMTEAEVARHAITDKKPGWLDIHPTLLMDDCGPDEPTYRPRGRTVSVVFRAFLARESWVTEPQLAKHLHNNPTYYPEWNDGRRGRLKRILKALTLAGLLEDSPPSHNRPDQGPRYRIRRCYRA